MIRGMIRYYCAILVAVVALLPGLCGAAGVGAITRPSKDVTLSFVRPGRIAKVLVKEGDTVKAGQLLVQQDDEAEKAQLEQLEAQAKDETHVEAAEAQLAQKTEDFKKLESLGKDGAVTQWDVAHAKLDVTIAQLSLKLAQFNHRQSRRKHKETKILVDRMRLLSPIAGKVERTFVQPGESADKLQNVIRVVKINPLRIDVPVPLEQARGLKLGQPAQVKFEKNEPAVTGKITHIAAVADAASDTLTVRVELPNPAERPAGEHVKVSFPPTIVKERSK